MFGNTIQVPHEWDIYDIDNELRQCKKQGAETNTLNWKCRAWASQNTKGTNLSQKKEDEGQERICGVQLLAGNMKLC